MRAHHVRLGLALAGLIVLGWVGACADQGPEPPLSPPPSSPPPQGLVVSNPTVALSTSARLSATVPLSTENEDVAYASLMPETAPPGLIASVRAIGSGSLVWTTVTNGGFDPVAVTAGLGDTIEVIVHDTSGADVYVSRVAVARIRAPVVVRTEPPPRKRDVPLNAPIVIVFSEPVDQATLTRYSVWLIRGTFPSPLTGTVRSIPGSGAVVAFTPTVRLARNTDYRLVVTREVRDLDGDALAAGATVEFTTGQASVGPPASIDLSPDTVYMTGPTYQMTATVQDAEGNQLIGQPIVWSTSDPNGLAVSPTGLVTALAGGGYEVVARVNNLEARALVVFAAGPSASLTVSPAPATVAVGDTIVLTATVRDAAGYLVSYPSVNWTSSDLAAATVAAESSATPGRAFAKVAGEKTGSGTITATSGTVSGTAAVTVIPPMPVASVTVTPGSATVIEQQTVRLSAALRDANARVLSGRAVTWASDDSAVATVDSSGLVTAIAAGSATVTATSDGVSGNATITVIPPPPVASVTVTPGSATVVAQGMVLLYAMLHDTKDSVLERPITWTSDNPVVGTVEATPQVGNAWVTAIGPGVATITATSEGVSGTASINVMVVELATVTTGTAYGCGLTPSGAAYCWGHNWAGQLGDSSTNGRFWPAPVAGARTFAQVSAGYMHTCAVTSTGAAYCWGSGYLGVADGGLWHPTPVAVSGGLTFSSVSVGYDHACGLATDGVAYCWGSNRAGQLGIGSSDEFRETPVAVAGGLHFASLSAGPFHTCGVTTSGAAYCWGDNGYGQLGIGSAAGTEECVYSTFGPCSRTPVAVAGGLVFSSVSPGWTHTCGVATSGAGTATCCRQSRITRSIWWCRIRPMCRSATKPACSGRCAIMNPAPRSSPARPGSKFTSACWPMQNAFCVRADGSWWSLATIAGTGCSP